MNISQVESEIYGYRIGRNTAYSEKFDAEEFTADLNQESIDIYRLKVNGNQESLMQELKNLHIPYDVFTINYLNQGPINIESAITIPPEFTSKVLEDPARDNDFMSILEDILQSKSWFEYQSPILQSCMPLEKRKQAALKYYSSFSKEKDTNNASVLLMKDNEAIGIMIGYKDSNTYNGILFGIIKKYRKHGYAKYAYLLMREHWGKMALNRFQNDVNIFNVASQKANYAQNINAIGVYFNITIYPFLDLKHKGSERVDIPKADLSNVVHLVSQKFPDFEISECKHKSYLPSKNSSFQSVLRTVINNTDYKFLVFHTILENKVLESYYISMHKRE